MTTPPRLSTFSPATIASSISADNGVYLGAVPSQLLADRLDNQAIAQRTRGRILGHASDVRGRCGRKDVLDPRIAAKIEALEPAVIKQMREILLGARNRADSGELPALKT